MTWRISYFSRPRSVPRQQQLPAAAWLLAPFDTSSATEMESSTKQSQELLVQLAAVTQGTAYSGFSLTKSTMNDSASPRGDLPLALAQSRRCKRNFVDECREQTLYSARTWIDCNALCRRKSAQGRAQRFRATIHSVRVPSISRFPFSTSFGSESKPRRVTLLR